MNTYQTVLRKMRTEAQTPVQYYLSLEEGELPMNDLLGQQLTLRFAGYHCLHCGQPKEIYRDSVRNVFLKPQRWGSGSSAQS